MPLEIDRHRYPMVSILVLLCLKTLSYTERRVTTVEAVLGGHNCFEARLDLATQWIAGPSLFWDLPDLGTAQMDRFCEIHFDLSSKGFDSLKQLQAAPGGSWETRSIDRMHSGLTRSLQLYLQSPPRIGFEDSPNHFSDIALPNRFRRARKIRGKVNTMWSPGDGWSKNINKNHLEVQDNVTTGLISMSASRV